MKRILLIIIATIMTLLSPVARAAVCAVSAACPTPATCACQEWMPRTPQGWTVTYKDMAVTPGWMKACTGVGGDGYCFKTQIPPGEWTVSVLGDLDVEWPGGWVGHIRFLQINANGPHHVFDNSSCSGGSFVAAGSGLWTLNFGPGTGSVWWPSCIRVRN